MAIHSPMIHIERKFESEENETPKSPLSQVYPRLFRERPEPEIYCAMNFRDTVDIEALKNEISNSIIIKHPRFCSLMVRDHTGNHWKKTHVNIDDHVIIHQNNSWWGVSADDDDDDDDKKEAAMNSFLEEMAVSSSLSESKPLWELHVLAGLKCVVFRIHHALGDGASLISLLRTCFAKKNDDDDGDGDDEDEDDGDGDDDDDGRSLMNDFVKNIPKGVSRVKGILGLVKSLWLTLVFMLRILGRLLWVKNKGSALSGGGGDDGVELWTTKLVTVKFLLEDFKSIKLLIPHVTVNDVLLGVISSGITKYLNINSSKGKQKTVQLTAAITVNLRKHPYIEGISDLMTFNSNGWGNKTGIVFLPIRCCNELHPLDHVRAMKAIMDTKKHSFEAYFGFKIFHFLISLGLIKIVNWSIQKLIANTTLMVSNIKGPLEEIVIADNPITHMRLSASSAPQVMLAHMISYAGEANVQVMVATEIIPDPEILVKFFQDSFLEMKNSIDIKDNLVFYQKKEE